MPKIIPITDQNNLVEAKEFKYGKLPFENFNPIQSRIHEIYDQDANFLIAASTSSGKTVLSEQILSWDIRENKSKGMYLSPYKALTQEKIDDWGEENHHFKDLNLAICTGDYRLTSERKKELDQSDIILCTTEMLDSVTRNSKSDKNEFINAVKTAVVDEFHMCLEPGRGDKQEVGLMKLTELNPDVRIVGLSATMPNVKEIAEWLSKLNGKDTYVLESQYRPCPLQTHYIAYNDSAWKYEHKELAKISAAIELITTHFNDKFLVVVHSKKTGELLIKQLEQCKVEAEYHNANLAKDKRLKIENRFRIDPKLRVLVATSGVGTGLNLPARRVIVLGVHSGLQEVESYKIRQYVGRAGRPKYDPRGDAYVLVPKKEVAQQVQRLQIVEPITSQLIDKNGNFKVMAFHLINEINHQNVKTREDIFKWYDRTLAAHQNKDLSHQIIEKMINALKASGSIKEENNEFITTSIGRIASMFYYSPFDVSDLNKNFKILFDNNKQLDEYWIAMALANIDSNRYGFMNATEKEHIGEFVKQIPIKLTTSMAKEDFTDSVKKAGYCYYCMLNGISSPVFFSAQSGLRNDFQRLNEVILSLDSMMKWNEKDYLKKMSKKVNYGVEWNLLDLCELPGIGKVKAKRLFDSNIKTVNDIISKPNIVKIALGLSDIKLNEIVDQATLLKLRD